MREAMVWGAAARGRGYAGRARGGDGWCGKARIWPNGPRAGIACTRPLSFFILNLELGSPGLVLEHEVFWGGIPCMVVVASFSAKGGRPLVV
jgi:hypothetical protein